MIFSPRKIRLRNVLADAYKNKYAVGQFNFSAQEQLQGIVSAAEELKTPVICGTSEGEAGFFGMEEAVLLVRAACRKKGIKAFLNFDHGKSAEIIKKAVDSGYDMVHFDGSDMSFEENVKITREVVKYARRKGVLVEGEFARIGGRSVVSADNPEENILTSIEKVVKFIKETGVDCIALDIGSVHGIHAKFPSIRHERITQLLEKVFSFVVLHGGSGVLKEDIKNVIDRGAVKINVNTDLRLAWRRAIQESLEANPEEIVPYKILPSVRDAVYEEVKRKINLFRNAF